MGVAALYPVAARRIGCVLLVQDIANADWLSGVVVPVPRFGVASASVVVVATPVVRVVSSSVVSVPIAVVVPSVFWSVAAGTWSFLAARLLTVPRVFARVVVRGGCSFRVCSLWLALCGYKFFVLR